MAASDDAQIKMITNIISGNCFFDLIYLCSDNMNF